MKQTIYYGGDILTMEEPITVEAILVKDGIISQAGSLRDILAQKDEQTVLEHLHGKTLLPAFLDPHSHITALASTMGLAKAVRAALTTWFRALRNSSTNAPSRPDNG